MRQMYYDKWSGWLLKPQAVLTYPKGHIFILLSGGVFVHPNCFGSAADVCHHLQPTAMTKQVLLKPEPEPEPPSTLFVCLFVPNPLL